MRHSSDSSEDERPPGRVAGLYVRTTQQSAVALSSHRLSIGASLTLCAAAALFAVASLPARGEELVEGGNIVNVDEAGQRGMPATNPRVSGLLAAHPSQFAVICVAGCDGKPKIVQLLPRPVTSRVGEFRPSAAAPGSDFAPGERRRPVGAAALDVNAVVCVAGCAGRPGQVLQRVELPPRPKPAPMPTAELPPLPPEAVPAATPNEPLDIVR